MCGQYQSILNSSGSSLDSDERKLRYKISAFDVWALGITVVIGGQYFSWNQGLEAGFGSFAIATILIASGYFCLCLCVSEVTSCLPFAGGAYGLARVSLGFYFGFLVGCCETIEYILYVATSIVSLGSMIANIAPATAHYQPLIWFAFYATALAIYAVGGKRFWSWSLALALVSFLVVLIYSFGSLQWTNFQRYAPIEGQWFIGGGSQFLLVYPLPAWFYVGIETLNFTSEDVANPRSSIPMGQIACMGTLVVTSLLVLFVSASLPPGAGEMAKQGVAFNTGE